MGSLSGGLQISINWYGWQRYMSLGSGSSTKSPQNFHSLILNLGMHIIHIQAVFWKFAYPQFTGYEEYIRFCHKEHLKWLIMSLNDLFCVFQKQIVYEYSDYHPVRRLCWPPTVTAENVTLNNTCETNDLDLFCCDTEACNGAVLFQLNLSALTTAIFTAIFCLKIFG